MRLLALLLLFAACTGDVREVQIARANTFYVARGEVVGRLYVNGVDVATCPVSGLLLVVCKPMIAWPADEKLSVELAVEGVGLARGEIDARTQHDGTHSLLLDTSDDVLAAGITFTVHVRPLFSMLSAVVLYVFLGLSIAFVLWAVVLRSRFLTPEDERVRRSVALVSATIAVAAAWLAMLPLADHGRELPPAVLGIPSGLGAYALTAVLIDGVARRRATGKRIMLGLASLATIVILPWALTVTLIPTSYVVIVALITVLLVLLP